MSELKHLATTAGIVDTVADWLRNASAHTVHCPAPARRVLSISKKCLQSQNIISLSFVFSCTYAVKFFRNFGASRLHITWITDAGTQPPGFTTIAKQQLLNEVPCSFPAIASQLPSHCITLISTFLGIITVTIIVIIINMCVLWEILTPVCFCH